MPFKPPYYFLFLLGTTLHTGNYFKKNTCDYWLSIFPIVSSRKGRMVSNMSVLFTILSVFSIRLVVGAYRVIRNKFCRLMNNNINYQQYKNTNMNHLGLGKNSSYLCFTTWIHMLRYIILTLRSSVTYFIKYEQ